MLVVTVVPSARNNLAGAKIQGNEEWRIKNEEWRSIGWILQTHIYLDHPACINIWGLSEQERNRTSSGEKEKYRHAFL
jgi:hypothetical protein